VGIPRKETCVFHREIAIGDWGHSSQLSSERWHLRSRDDVLRFMVYDHPVCSKNVAASLGVLPMVGVANG
jgi:hypothetical protein